MMKRLPFDSLCLAAAVFELQELVSGRVQKAWQPTNDSVVLSIYSAGAERLVLLSCSRPFARIHRTAHRTESAGPLPQLGSMLRQKVSGSRLTSVRQVGFDRMAHFEFQTEEGSYRLIAELTGKNANLILTGPEGKVVASARSVPRSKSVRPILPGVSYAPPPFPSRPTLFQARSLAELSAAEGASPFLVQLLQAASGGHTASWPAIREKLDRIEQSVQTGQYEPVTAPGLGGYPISVAALGYSEKASDRYWQAVDLEFRLAEAATAREALRHRLLTPLRRVLLAREVALQDLDQAIAAAKQAPYRQQMGELILAYAHQIQPGQEQLQTSDYEGNPVMIPLDPEASPIENAQRLFEKAKHAKARAAHVRDQRHRLETDRVALLGAIRRIEDASELEDLAREEQQARARRWFVPQATPERSVEDRPFEGHRIREFVGPGGCRVLLGDNATSNDYLTQRVAKPNDWWLHVRGSASAHAVIVTQNRPERIGLEALNFAARLVVQHSPSKHSSYVPVDYTLKKHVRKPRGAPPGTVTYANEKTLHVQKDH